MRALATSIVVLAVAFLNSPGVASQSASRPPAGAQAADLKERVSLVGADAKATLAISVPLGLLPVMTLTVGNVLPGERQGELQVGNLASQAEQPPHIAATMVRLVRDTPGPGGSPRVPITLTPGTKVDFQMVADQLRPGRTYKGQLILLAGGRVTQWDLMITTGGQKILAVDPALTLKFVGSPLCTWLGLSSSPLGTFSFALRDKSQSESYDHVRVRFEQTTPPASKAITSRFSLDTFTFLQGDPPTAVDLAQRADSAGSVAGVSIRGQRTFMARVGCLLPGEYGGALRFTADGTPDDAADAKLSVTIQVRDPWLLPVLVLLMGSGTGWYSSRYVAGVRRARELTLKTQVLRAEADDFARGQTPERGWTFPGESTSYALTRVRVILNQLARQASSPLEVMAREAEITQLFSDAERRLAALGTLRRLRLDAQQFAATRPSAQEGLGQLLHRINDVLELATFGESERAQFDKLLQAGQMWLAPETSEGMYRAAIRDWRRSAEVPSGPQAGRLDDPLKTELLKLLENCPKVEMIELPANAGATLLNFDRTIAHLVLLWRERNRPWAQDLARQHQQGASLDDLYETVDQRFWEQLDGIAKADKLELELANGRDPEALDLVEVTLKSTDPDISTERILYHPLRVTWRIVPPHGTTRSTTTDRLTLVQYFPTTGAVQVSATLTWRGKTIPIKTPRSFRVVADSDRSNRRVVFGEFSEYAVLAVAAGFAIATAMSTQYDPTFGSFSQYLTLFGWAAGTGTGGNMFKQLGTTSTPGGSGDNVLPSANR